MSKGSISKKKNSTPEKGIRKNEKEEEEYLVLWREMQELETSNYSIQ
jgi:hypothetical protein